MEKILLSPPIAFVIILIVTALLALIFSFLAFRPQGGKRSARISEAYSCGEEFPDHMIQPDYSQFFPFAFFFTILHVVALVVATVDTQSPQTFAIAIIYVIVAIVSMYILLRR